MTDTIAAIEAAHVLYRYDDPPDSAISEWCDYCGQPWPCDTEVMRRRLREVERERDAVAVNAAADRRAFGISSKRLLAERDAARAEVQRLEEHLRRVIAAHDESRVTVQPPRQERDADGDEDG